MCFLYFKGIKNYIDACSFSGKTELYKQKSEKTHETQGKNNKRSKEEPRGQHWLTISQLPRRHEDKDVFNKLSLYNQILYTGQLPTEPDNIIFKIFNFF